MGSINRRQAIGAGLAAVAAWPLLARAGEAPGAPTFALGVASGCPRPDSVVLWTRLIFPEAPSDPFSFAPVVEAPRGPVEIDWVIALDRELTRIVQSGRYETVGDFAHSAHIEVTGLEAGMTYYYRFATATVASAVGRTRTAPPAGSMEPVTFAYASCQHFEQGFYAAYRDMAGRDLDFVLHLGDYIYESSSGAGRVRSHDGPIPTTLGEFRARHATYKSDANLQSAHAAFAWLLIWDDHEVVNNYYSDAAPTAPQAEAFLARRRAAYQAWYEHMPVPPHIEPGFDNLTIRDYYSFGSLLDLALLDARQYRTHVAQSLAEAADPDRTMLGPDQEEWLARRLSVAQARWTMIAQPTLLSERVSGSGKEADILDGWDGYQAARRRLLGMVDAAGVSNPVFVGGDVHTFYAAELPRDFLEPAPGNLAVEFTVGSITSNGPSAKATAAALAGNSHIKFAEGQQHGYAIARVSATRLETQFLAVSDRADPDATTFNLASFAVADGEPALITTGPHTS